MTDPLTWTQDRHTGIHSAHTSHGRYTVRWIGWAYEIRHNDASLGTWASRTRAEQRAEDDHLERSERVPDKADRGQQIMTAASTIFYSLVIFLAMTIVLGALFDPSVDGIDGAVASLIVAVASVGLTITLTRRWR